MNEDLTKKILRTSLDWTTDEIRSEERRVGKEC